MSVRRILVPSFLLSALLVLTTACGSSTNFNQIWGGDDEATDSLVTKARVLYDQGDFEGAKDLAEKAIERNPANMDAGVLLGYVYLSLGGIDPYRLARELIALEEDKEKEKGETADDAGSEDEAGTENKADDATSTLQALGTLINLSAADFDTLGSTLKEYSDANPDFTLKSTLFDETAGGTELIVPAKPKEVRSSVEVLDYMNKAIMTVCRFVDPYTLIDESTRHQSADCASVTSGDSNAKAHFLWAFAHLTEALVYQSVLLYSSAENASSQSNFQAAAKDLDTFTGDFTAFANSIEDMAAATDLVFDTSDVDSMISETLFDLEAVNRSFSVLTGLPKKLTERITKAMDRIREVGKEVSGTSDVTGNTTALKGQMTEKFSKVASEKVDKAVNSKIAKMQDLGVPAGTTIETFDPSVLPQEEQVKFQNEVKPVCSSFDKLTAGVPEQKKPKSAACEKFGG